MCKKLPTAQAGMSLLLHSLSGVQRNNRQGERQKAEGKSPERVHQTERAQGKEEDQKRKEICAEIKNKGAAMNRTQQKERRNNVRLCTLPRGKGTEQ